MMKKVNKLVREGALLWSRTDAKNFLGDFSGRCTQICSRAVCGRSTEIKMTAFDFVEVRPLSIV